VADAVAKTGQWNDMLNESKRLVDMNKGVKSVLKTYPDTGHQWVDLAPEGLQAEGDAMRHCVGGYCNAVKDGHTRILSLRDAQGNPQATVELRPSAKNIPQNTDGLVPGDEDAYHKAEQLTEYLTRQGIDPDAAWGRGESMVGPRPGDAFKGIEQHQAPFEDWYTKTFLQPKPSVGPAWDINQIKGPANRAPSADVQPMVQDLVRGGMHPDLSNWGRVGDLQNSGLRDISGWRDAVEKAGADPGLSDKFFTALGHPKYATGEDLDRMTDGMGSRSYGFNELADHINSGNFDAGSPAPEVPGYASGGSVTDPMSALSNYLAPLGGWATGYMNGSTPAVSTPSTAADFSLPTVTAGGHATTDTTGGGRGVTLGGSPGAGTGTAGDLSRAASWAGLAAQLAKDPALGQAAGLIGTAADASAGQYGSLGSVVGRMLSNTPVAGTLGSLVGQAASDGGINGRNVANTVASAVPGVGPLYGAANFITGGALGASLFGSDMSPTASGGYTPAQPGIFGNFGTQTTPAQAASDAAAAANNPNYSNEGRSAAPSSSAESGGTSMNAGKAADDHVGGGSESTG
jgi:hypothetical protein